MLGAFLISTWVAKSMRSVLNSSLVIAEVVSFHSTPIIFDSKSHKIRKYGPSYSSVSLIALLLGLMRLHRAVQTQLLPVGAELLQEVFGFTDDFRFFCFAHHKNDDIVRAGPLRHHERIRAARFSSDVSVFDVRGVKHKMRHRHGHYFGRVWSRICPHQWGDHVADSCAIGFPIGLRKK